MEKGTMDGSSNSTQGYLKVASNYHHQSHQSHHHQRSPSMDNNGHHQLHQHQHQHHAKPPVPAHQHQQYHPKAHIQYGRNEGTGGGVDYSSYPPPPGNAIQNHPNHYHPHYAPHSRSTTPGVRSVVTHSFSMEEEQREDGSSRYGGHHRGQNQRDPGSYLRDEYRSPPTEFHPDRSSEQHQQREQQERSFELQPPLVSPPHFNSRRDYQYGNGRDLPLVLEAPEGLIPPRGSSRRSGDHNPSERVKPSPQEEAPASAIERSLSSVSAGGPRKRSFWHHSRPVQATTAANEEYGNEGSMSTSLSSLPQEFMPPKRSKTSASESPSGSPKREKEYIVTARSQASSSNQQQQQQHEQQQMLDISRVNSDVGSLGGTRSSPPGAGLSPTDGWYNSRSRSMSWEAREDYYRRDPRSLSWSSPNGRDGPAPMSNGSGPHWMGAPYMPSPRSRHANEGSHYEVPLQSWEASPREWGHHHNPHHHQQQQQHYPPHMPYLAWSAGSNGKGGDLQQRDQNSENKFPQQGQDHVGFGSEQQHPGMHFTDRGAPPQPLGIGPMMGIPMPTSSGVEPSSMMKGQSRDMTESDGRGLNKNGPVKLLALPEDRISLSETLCIVRENVEVFTATIEDVEAPAPGRKHAVTVGQVGLRCIHCRHTTRSSERVKRAVCYPSSIKRIYRTVIDMKLDHFLHCKFVPQNLKDTLEALKANNTRSTGTTMQYFIRAATTLGMVDGPSGVRITDSNSPTPAISMTSPNNSSAGGKPKLVTSSPALSKGKGQISAKADKGLQSSGKGSESSPGGDFRIHRVGSMSSEGTAQASVTTGDSDVPSELFTGKVALSVPEDKMSLSPLRCFLRQQVCAFSATEEDIAVRTPTTFAVSVGQVGIGCIHCLGQPAKLRLNRAVCFPFSIARIYQSVADIQRFHLSECKMVPKDTRETFLKLQSQSSKGSKGLATRQYWVTSAKKIGLVDTSKGIRFCRDPAVPAKKAVSLDILAQVASNVTTVNKPLVLPEDKPYIAEFLYVVMGQLQPCRFTEADRNKRRLKDVGCIGVECKHCAGQVDGRKFFWSSVNAVESNFVSVHTHMMECRMVSKEMKEDLVEFKKLRKEQTAALKTGSQKAFFARVWKRLHEEPKKQKEEEKSTEKKANADGTDEIDPAVKATFIVSLSHDTLDSSVHMNMTPTTSPATIEKPFTEITVGKISPGSPDSIQKIDAVSDKMAMAGI